MEFLRSGPPSGFPWPEVWVEPKHGYETDLAILARKDKDVQYGYKSEVYQKYIATVPKLVLRLLCRRILVRHETVLQKCVILLRNTTKAI